VTGLKADVNTIEQFEEILRDTLTHLYDPAYQPSDSLWFSMGIRPEEGVEAIQYTIIQAIENLKPTSDIPSNARSKRFYELLSYRYVQQLTQEETAERLGLTTRHLRREQQQAIHVLARHLWQQGSDITPSQSTDDQNETQTLETKEPTTWRAQVRQELASLRQNAPGLVADVETAVQGIMKLGQAITSQHGIHLEVEPVSPNLTVAMHPTALRQILITAIEKLVQDISPEKITLGASRRGENVHFTVTGVPVNADHYPPNSDLIQEILAAQDGSIEAFLEDDRTGFRIELPRASKITVMVIDDNADLVHFYRRYITGTRYQIVHVSEGHRALETLTETNPDVIVLDVMLPDIDGWELLTDLREQPTIQEIPIIVCSVVRREELALALGASLFISKPVRRQHLIQALEQVLT
jgi:CheY-like chemotaxis protein